jgi:hypothetical protein
MLAQDRYVARTPYPVNPHSASGVPEESKSRATASLGANPACLALLRRFAAAR